MNLDFNLLTLVLEAFGVIGIVSWFKSMRDALKAKKGLGLVILSLVASVAVGFGANIGNLAGALTTSWILLAFVELGYTLIVRTVLNLVGKLAGPAVEVPTVFTLPSRGGQDGSPLTEDSPPPPESQPPPDPAPRGVTLSPVGQ